MATLYLIRHGEPAVRGVFLGVLDPKLSIAGREAVAQTLADVKVSVTYCSPLLRARETAEHLQAGRVVVCDDLREIDYGAWTGKTWAEIETGWPEIAARKSADWLGVSPPAGESWAQVLRRVRLVWDIIRCGEGPAAVVAHQGVNSALAYIIDGRNPLEFRQGYGEVVRVEFD